jgi:pimeloyl-ACP methyl ester carboxylesterase
MGRFSRISGAPLGLLVVTVLLLLPGSGALAGPGRAGSPAAPAAVHVPPGVHAVLREVLPSGITVSNVAYASSVDGFLLSYSEVLPAGYVATDRYPLLVGLHGIDLAHSTPMPGGYPTTLDNETMNDTSAAGFILLVPNTRTDDGFYIDSQYTGPQAQDIQDAIASEEARRLVGLVYLYGFSMGSMGALSIGLQHPGEFAGIGSVATFSDIYQAYENQVAAGGTGLNDALLNVTGGALPSASTYAAGIFNELTELRQHPERTRGVRMYLVSGGNDVLATNNVNLWPYLQANDTTLQTTCLVATQIGEPTNCTLPLEALYAADPTNYSYRFVYEQNGVHSYRQVNVTDMLNFFRGSAPSGPFVGTFPDPVVTEPAVPLVSLVTQPFSCGTVAWNGTSLPDGNTLTVPRGSYPVAASPCPGYRFSGFVGRGGVGYDALTGSANVVGSGALVAEFAYAGSSTNASYSLTVSASNGCPSVSVNGSAVANGAQVTLSAGEYVAEAAPCAGWSFQSWSSTGGVRVWSPTDPTTGLTLSANGSLDANYLLLGPGDTLQVFVSPPSCGSVFINGSAQGNGSIRNLPPGSYSLVAPACAGYVFAGWSFSGGVTAVGTGAVTTLVVSSDGTLTAIYATSAGSVPDLLAFSVSPTWCGAVISVNGGLYSNGASAGLVPGTYDLAALNCTGAEFQGWSTSGGAAVSGTMLIVSGNGTLGAQYVIASDGGTHHANQTTSESLLSTLAPYLAGAIGLAVGLLVGLGVTRMRASRSNSADAPARRPPG